MQKKGPPTQRALTTHLERILAEMAKQHIYENGRVE